MRLIISRNLLDEIQRHGEASYPEEGAGLLLGRESNGARHTLAIRPIANTFQADQRRRRYLIDPLDMLAAEEQAEQEGMQVLGIFHSHPDHPAEPSAYDLRWSLPWYSYVITRVERGRAIETRSFRLRADRSAFDEEIILSEESEIKEHP